MKAHQKTEGLNDEWLTPPSILSKLGNFDLDPCSAINAPWKTADEIYTIVDDGLDKNWNGRVWLNPPFNRYERHKWMKKMAEHNNGIMLIPAATETSAFFEYVWNTATGICFVKSRPHFHYIDGSRAKANCGTAIALIAYGEANYNILEQSGLGFCSRISFEKEFD